MARPMSITERLRGRDIITQNAGLGLTALTWFADELISVTPDADVAHLADAFAEAYIRDAEVDLLQVADAVRLWLSGPVQHRIGKNEHGARAWLIDSLKALYRYQLNVAAPDSAVDHIAWAHGLRDVIRAAGGWGTAKTAEAAAEFITGLLRAAPPRIICGVGVFAYQKLRLDAAPYEVVAYLDMSARWVIIPDPDEKLDHLAATHTTGHVVRIPYAAGETAEREQLMAAVMDIVAEEVAWARDATDRDRAAVVVYLTGIMQELRPEPPTRRVRPCRRAEGGTASEDRATAGVSDDLLHLALAYIRALTRMEPTPAEREAADRRSYPATLACYTCAYDGIEVERPVIALGDIVNPADPTQTYKLACGHTTF